MLENENKMQKLDLTVVIILFIAGCILGKFFMSLKDTWLSFNGPALGILALGELVWWRVRKLIMWKGCSDGRDS